MSEKYKQSAWQYFLEEFQKETDRSSVILSASMLDEVLRVLLKTHLVPVPSSSDDLFEGATAPLAAFSSRIDFAYRLGLISKRLTRDLHLIRKIRNEFAHNITGCHFENSSVKSRIIELKRSFSEMTLVSDIQNLHGDTPRGHFSMCVAWIIWHLWDMVNTATSITECQEEWGYRFSEFEYKGKKEPNTASKTPKLTSTPNKKKTEKKA